MYIIFAHIRSDLILFVNDSAQLSTRYNKEPACELNKLKYSRAHNTSHQPKRNPKLANTSVRRPQAHNCYIALAQLVYTNAPPRSLLVLSFKKECNPTTLFIKNKVYQISLNLHKKYYIYHTK